MTTRDALQRLRSWQQGRPLPRGETLPWPKLSDEHSLVLAFVRMAGETLPWAIAIGRPDQAPSLYSVPDPRKVDDVIAMLVDLGPVILGHLHHPMTLTQDQRESLRSDQDAFFSELPARQLWLPGSSHRAMMHLLDYRLSPARRADKKTLAVINPLGRALGWLFRESTRPGQLRVMTASSCLTTVYDFPAEDLRLQHLGFLLAWLQTPGDREARRQAAAKAEQQAVSMTMDPAFERESLSKLVESYNQALAAEAESSLEPEQRESARHSAAIKGLVEDEVLRRWRLTVSARALLFADGRESNAAMDKLVKLSEDEYRYQYYRNERPREFADDVKAPPRVGPDPETDRSPSAAASRFFMHQYSEDLAFSELIHGDAELVEIALERGDAIRGVIAQVLDEGAGRASKPVWVVVSRDAGVLRLRKGSGVCVLGLRGRTGRIRSVSMNDDGRVFEVVIQNWKRARANAPAANDEEALEGRAVTLVADSPAELSRSKAAKVWGRRTPGSWLTHADPAPLPDAKSKVRRDLLSLVKELEKEA